MYLRNGKFYSLSDEWWFKYTIEACLKRESSFFVKDYCLFELTYYNKYTVKEWIENIVPQFHSTCSQMNY